MRTVTMKEYGLCRWDDASTFTLGELEIALNNFPTKSGEFLFCGYCNGKQVVKATVTAEKNTVTIPAEKLAAGKFSAYVLHAVNGTEVKRYPVEGLLIAEANGTLAADPEIAALTAEIAALKEEAGAEKKRRSEAEARLAALEKTAEELEKRLSVVEQNIDIFEN